MKNPKVLVACEESQRVCSAFRERGIEAYSCDIQEPSGGHPEWHILGDVLPLICKSDINTLVFHTMDGEPHLIKGGWDLIIAHPPCTYLSKVSNRSFSLDKTPPEKVSMRWKNRAIAAVFFMQFTNANGKHIAIENPTGFMNTAYRRPDQIISPYMFAKSIDDPEYVKKETCLWTYRLPMLTPGDLPIPNNKDLFGTYSSGKAKSWEEMVTKDRAKERSKTFHGIARAMAQQWGDYLLQLDE